MVLIILNNVHLDTVFSLKVLMVLIILNNVCYLDTVFSLNELC